MTHELHAAASALQKIMRVSYDYEIHHVDAVTLARAVLTAVREPSDKILEAVGVQFAMFDGNVDSFKDFSPDVVRGFIDAILAD